MIEKLSLKRVVGARSSKTAELSSSTVGCGRGTVSMSQSVSIVPSSGSGSGSLSHMRRSMRKVPLSTSKTGRASTRGEERRIVISSGKTSPFQTTLSFKNVNTLWCQGSTLTVNCTCRAAARFCTAGRCPCSCTLLTVNGVVRAAARFCSAGRCARGHDVGAMAPGRANGLYVVVVIVRIQFCTPGGS